METKSYSEYRKRQNQRKKRIWFIECILSNKTLKYTILLSIVSAFFVSMENISYYELHQKIILNSFDFLPIDILTIGIFILLTTEKK